MPDDSEIVQVGVCDNKTILRRNSIALNFLKATENPLNISRVLIYVRNRKLSWIFHINTAQKAEVISQLAEQKHLNK